MLRRVVAWFTENLVPNESLQQRVVTGSVWLFGIRGFGRALALIKIAVLARLLSPSDFGLMGIALLIMAGLNRFSNLGLNTALIQREEDDIDAYLDTTWLMKIGRGAALGLIAFTAAPLFGAFFGEPRATGLIQALALLPILTGLVNPGIVYFDKELEFHKKFAYDMSGNVVNIVAALSYAAVNPTVWALVVGHLAEGIVKLGLSYLLHDYRPSPRFELSKAKELFDYGKWLTLGAMLTFGINQGDDAFVGWYLGAGALGFYQLAFRFGNAPATELSNIVSSALLPAFSEVQNEADKLRSMFRKTIQIISLVAFPAGIGIAVVAPVFVPVILGDKWTPLVTELQILAFWGVFRSLQPIFGKLFQALGRPDIGTKINAGRLGLMAILILPATARYGTEGTAATVLVTALASTVVYGYLATRMVEFTPRELIVQLAYPLLVATIMGLSVYGVYRQGILSSGLVELLGLVGMGAIIYLLLTVGLSRLTSYDALSTVSVAVNSLR